MKLVQATMKLHLYLVNNWSNSKGLDIPGVRIIRLRSSNIM